MDNLANSFSTLQNSQLRKKQIVFLKYSKLMWNICTVLYVEGFIQGFEKKNKDILIYLKYFQGEPVLHKISKISLQGRRVYTKKIGSVYSGNKILPVKKGLGIRILSTSKGVMCDRDARYFGVGGEILCEIF